MEQPLISVIIPIYKVEKYLDKCISSVSAQTYSNLEIILINDGSPDGCNKICENWKAKDSRIIYIKQENGGISSARNAGLDIAKGDYIGFVDSDDYIAPTMYEDLFKALKATDAGFSVCDHHDVNEENYAHDVEAYRPILESKVYSSSEYIAQTFLNIKVVNYVIAMNKLFKAELFNGLRFPLNKIHEDEFLIHHLVHRAQKIVTISQKEYYYVQRFGSIMSTIYSNPRVTNCIEAYEDRLQMLISNNYPDWLCEKAKLEELKYAMYLYAMIKYQNHNNEADSTNLTYLMEIITKHRTSILKSPTVPLKYKIHITAFRDITWLWYCYICLSNNIKKILRIYK